MPMIPIRTSWRNKARLATLLAHQRCAPAEAFDDSPQMKRPSRRAPEARISFSTDSKPSNKRRIAGVTLIELIIAMAILSILMSGILPLSYMAYQRSREIELRQNLRIIRKALDEYKKKVEEGRIPTGSDESGYPPELEVLVEGVESTDAAPVIFKFLRRIPRDPMTEEGEWGLRAYADEPGSDIWGGAGCV